MRPRKRNGQFKSALEIAEAEMNAEVGRRNAYSSVGREPPILKDTLS